MTSDARNVCVATFVNKTKANQKKKKQKQSTNN